MLSTIIIWKFVQQTFYFQDYDQCSGLFSSSGPGNWNWYMMATFILLIVGLLTPLPKKCGILFPNQKQSIHTCTRVHTHAYSAKRKLFKNQLVRNINWAFSNETGNEHHRGTLYLTYRVYLLISL